jgi:aspartate racemase
MARRLEGAGAEALAMPCNTAHHFADAILGAAGCHSSTWWRFR